MKNEVLKFISLFKKDQKFLNGLCYWFSYMLKGRFPTGTIYYDPIYGHFYTLIDNVAYDVTGETQLPSKAIKWDTLQSTDEALYKIIIRDCVLKEGNLND